MTAPVYVLPTMDASVRIGDVLTLEGSEGHHAAAVRRTRPGEEIDIVNGQGLRVRTIVDEVAKKSLAVRATDVINEGEPTPRRIIVQALAKGGRDEQAVETCTEFGAHSFIPWAAQRSIASWKGKEAKGISRWAATAQAAAKQSRRSWIPNIYAGVVSTGELAELVRGSVARGAQAYLCHEEAQLRLIDCALEESEGEETWIIIGPEGGIDREESEALEEAGARRVLLGAHVLRSASAGAYALATLDAAYAASGKVKA